MPPLSNADKRLLQFLVKHAKADRAKLEVVERVAIAEGRSVIDVLAIQEVMSEEQVAAELSGALRIPLVDLSGVVFDDAAVQLVDHQVAVKLGIVPLRVEGNHLLLAMANPFDHEGIRDLEFATGRRIRPTAALRSAVLEAIEGCYKMPGAIGALLSQIPEEQKVSVLVDNNKGDDVSAEELSREAERAPVIKMVNCIFTEALKNRASDIHVEPGPNLVHVRYRVNGILEEGLQLPKWVQSAIVARIKVMAKLDITKRHIPQDGRLKIRAEDRTVDVRVSSLPTSDGEKMVMRVLDPTTALRRLDSVGLSRRDLNALRTAIRKPEGMILVTGPTGSGKTTTLYAVIQEIFSPEINIVTIENPIEYEMKAVNQVEVNVKQGLTFADVLRSTLRQDPDVILVGEIRDRETAEVAFHAAQTGHLVLSTVHTLDTSATVTRLLELGVEHHVLASSLVAVVAQRLVRTVCERCAEPAVVDEATAKALGLKGRTCMRGKGCPACRRSGFSGRTGVYEVLEVSKKIQQAIESRAPDSLVRRLSRSEGMTTLIEDAFAKIEAGHTTPEEVLGSVQVEAHGPTCPQCANPIEERFTVCPFCRHQLVRTCENCSEPLKPEWTGCPSCGAVKREHDVRGVASARSSLHAANDGALAPKPHSPDPGEITRPRILVVEDNEDLRVFIRKGLERVDSRFVFDEAADGLEALQKIEESPPHLILLDLMMPRMDGFEVCKRLRADLQTAFLPIIMLTARDDGNSKRLGFLAGTDDYVAKPFDAEELAARVRRLLERTYGLGAARMRSAAA
jgi:type II secretory ATPase GspE/PulE/Tfp pilus assembly ATPase PilB-like protein/ActR/RegA family two-component response regulator